MKINVASVSSICFGSVFIPSCVRSILMHVWLSIALESYSVPRERQHGDLSGAAEQAKRRRQHQMARKMKFSK
jgi:hypothetical protein